MLFLLRQETDKICHTVPNIIIHYFIKRAVTIKINGANLKVKHIKFRNERVLNFKEVPIHVFWL